jgi:hypothetical protein
LLQVSSAARLDDENEPSDANASGKVRYLLAVARPYVGSLHALSPYVRVSVTPRSTYCALAAIMLGKLALISTPATG